MLLPAFPYAPAPDETHIVRVACWARHTIWPTQRRKEFQAPVGIGKIINGFLQHVWFVHERIFYAESSGGVNELRDGGPSLNSVLEEVLQSELHDAGIFRGS